MSEYAILAGSHLSCRHSWDHAVLVRRFGCNHNPRAKELASAHQRLLRLQLLLWELGSTEQHLSLKLLWVMEQFQSGRQVANLPRWLRSTLNEWCLRFRNLQAVNSDFAKLAKLRWGSPYTFKWLYMQPSTLDKFFPHRLKVDFRLSACFFECSAYYSTFPTALSRPIKGSSLYCSSRWRQW